MKQHFAYYHHPSHDPYFVLDALGVVTTFLAGAVIGASGAVIGALLTCWALS